MILASILISDAESQAQDLAPKVLENIESFKRLHPGLEHRFFRGPEVRDFIAREYGGEVLAAYDALKPYAFKCDLARHCILLRHGGLYADLSVYFLNPWILQPPTLGVFRDFTSVAPWQMATTVYFTPPGHKAIAKAIELICENVRKHYYGASLLCPTGPVSFGKAIALACEPEDFIFGESAWVTDIPSLPGLIPGGAHGFVFQGELVAVKRKQGGVPSDEIRIDGGNTYQDLWERRDVYHCDKP